MKRGTKAAGQPNSQGKKASTAGLRPDGRTKRGTCRAWLIDGRGKAWSKRPDRQAGRQVGRPLSPARVRAMPKRFVVIERPKNRLIRKKAGQHRAKNRRHGQQEGRREVFRGKARGREGRVCHGVLVR